MLPITDSDLATTTITITDDVDNGTLSIDDDGEFTYTPNAGFTGTDQFVYELCNDVECCSSATVTIQVNEEPEVSATVTDATCGLDNGAINLTVTGGTPGYTFDWDDDSLDGTEDPTGLAAGTYSVTVTDANGCTVTTTETVGTTGGPTADAVATDVNCNGGSDGSIDLTVTDAADPVTYSWDNGETTEDLTGLTAGTYSVTVTDGNGCTATASATVNEPTALVLTPDVTNVTCNGFSDGVAGVEVSGGTPDYTFAWDTGDDTQTVSGLPAGDYTVTVTDANGCTEELTVTISESATELTVDASVQAEILCNGETGTALAVAGGGTAPYSYEWSNGDTDDTAEGLTAGDYDVTVTDDFGCTATATVTLSEPSAIEANATSTDVSCNGDSDGTATVAPSGGTPGYTYNWDNGETTATITGLSVGDYEVTITDDNDCTVTATVTVNDRMP